MTQSVLLPEQLFVSSSNHDACLNAMSDMLILVIGYWLDTRLVTSQFSSRTFHRMTHLKWTDPHTRETVPVYHEKERKETYLRALNCICYAVLKVLAHWVKWAHKGPALKLQKVQQKMFRINGNYQFKHLYYALCLNICSVVLQIRVEDV